MGSNWVGNSDARRRVSDILKQAGIPLELRVADECQRFCKQRRRKNGPGVDARKVVYSPLDDPDSYREVDQVIHIHKEFPIGSHTGIQFFGTVAIECKHRHDVEYFAFPVEGNRSHEGFPVWSSLAGSQLFKSLSTAYDRLEAFTSANVSMVEICDGKTPKGAYKENLLYNSAASLYDFVLADVGESPLIGREFDDEDRKTTEVFLKFKRYLEKNNYAWWSVLRDEIAALSLAQCRSFNKASFKGGPIYYGIRSHMPIVCVDGPIYRVSWDPVSGIKDYTEVESCLLTIRKQKWPGHARFALLRRTPEIPVVLTNPKGLPKALATALSWYGEIQHLLSTADSTLIARWPLEAAFYCKVLSHYGVSEGLGAYRSDLDIEEML
jgi:hypothetical protein